MASRDLQMQFRDLELSVEQKADLIERSRWGRSFTWSTVVKIVKFMGAYRLAKGATVFRQGDRSQFLLILLEGEVAIYKDNADGEEQQIAVLGPNRPLGEMGMIDGQARSATVRVTKECVALVLTTRGFDEMRENVPAVGRACVENGGCNFSKVSTSGQLADYM